MQIRVQEAPFEQGAELDRFTAGATNAGAIVSFTGIVRDDSGSLSEMLIEHYPGMTEKALAKIAQQAATRWTLTDGLILHRFGVMRPGDRIMMVATASRHRKDAFEAAEYLMDFLKSRAPFWKKERGAQGEDWVDAKEIDEDALSRW